MLWFRLYSDMDDDPKIGTLDDAAHRTWMQLLQFTCKIDADGDTKLADHNVDWALRRAVSTS